MKSKENKAFSPFFTLRIFCVTIFSILIALSATLCVSGAETARDFNSENYNLTDQYYMQLGEEINQYSSLDTSPEKAVSKGVTTAINVYRNELTALQEHEDVGNRLLSAEAALSYSKGQAAGMLAWIYYYNILEIKSTSSLTVIYDSYISLCNKVDQNDDAAVLDIERVKYCAELNKVVYREKISTLLSPEDSSDAGEVITVALRDLEDVGSSDIFAPELNEFYQNTVFELKLQRQRDFISNQLKDIFPIIVPDQDYEFNDSVMYFGYKIRHARAVEDMNNALRDAISELIAPKSSGAYSMLFVQALNDGIADAVVQASYENACVDINPFFENYTLKMSRAEAKDSIASIILSQNDPILVAIEQEFNRNGGTVDLCLSESELKLEKIRAQYRKDLIDNARSTKEKLLIILGNYDSIGFESRLNEHYESADADIKQLSSSTQRFEESCKKIADVANAAYKALLNEAKTERFLLDHKTIIKKPKEELVISDEIFLKSALSDFSLLEEEVRESIKPQIDSIAEKYNIVLNQKIIAIAPNDAFFLDLSEQIRNELKNLSANNIDVFYNNCEAILTKAQVLKKILDSYRTTVSGMVYQSYNSTEKSELSKICEVAAEDISRLPLTSITELASALEKISENAKLSMCRTNECARLRIAARSSELLEVQSIIFQARATIKASSDKSEMTSIADNAIFKINRELTKNEIAVRSEKQTYIIKGMSFLSATEKQDFTQKIASLKNNSAGDATLAENVTVLSFIWNSFSEALFELSEGANEKDLVRARAKYLSVMEEEYKKFASSLNSTLYLSNERREEFLNSANAILARAKTNTEKASSGVEVAAINTQTLEQFGNLSSIAFEEDLFNYKETLYKKLDEAKLLKSNYSVENYNKLENEIKLGKEKVKGASSSSEAKTRFQSVISSIESINTLLDDAKENAFKALDNALSVCRGDSILYSTQNLEKIERIYNDAISKIEAYKNISDASTVNEALSVALFSISEVKKDRLFTSQTAQAIANSGVQYPADYDFEKGYWGCVSSVNGISQGAIFSIHELSAKEDLSAIQALIRNAARQKKINAYESISNEKLKMLKKCVVLSGLELTLSKSSESVNSYSVQMLLPSKTEQENILGIVFIDENNNVEFYNIESANSLISFNLSHFSKYYIVCENTTNLRPLITFLLIILFFELLTLAMIGAFHFYRKRKENTTMPALSVLFINPFLATAILRVEPHNGVGIAIFLCAAVIALGCGIAFFAKLELNSLKAPREQSRGIKKSNSPKQISQKEAVLLREKQKVPALCSVRSTEEFEEGADELVNEDLIERLEDSDSEPSQEAQFFHKAEINIDSIAECFGAGALVTPELLKKKRLIRKKTDYVKILARGTLTKPLIIEAHDFSHAAEEMLKAVGGEAIRIK